MILYNFLHFSYTFLKLTSLKYYQYMYIIYSFANVLRNRQLVNSDSPKFS